MKKNILHVLLSISLSFCIMSCGGNIQEEYVRENPNITTRTIDNRAPQLYESDDYGGWNRNQVWRIKAYGASISQLQYKEANTTTWNNYREGYPGGLIGSNDLIVDKKNYSYGEVRFRLRSLDENLTEYVNSEYPINGKVSPWCDDLILYNDLWSNGTTINENMVGIILNVTFEGSGGIKTLKRTALSTFRAEISTNGRTIGSVSCLHDNVPSGHTEQYVFTEPKYGYLASGYMNVSLRNLNKNNRYLSEWSEPYTSITVKSGYTPPIVFKITVRVLRND